MNSCITAILGYPFSYIAKLRELTAEQILLKNTQFSPAYLFFLISSALCNLGLSAWMIYYFIQSDTSSCYSGVTWGVQVLACLYPLYQVVIFLTLVASVGSTEYNCWKVLVILFFTIVTTSFGFGGLGIVYACMVHQQDPFAIPSTFLIKNYFIEIIIYSMIIFIIMYCLLVPFSAWLESRRDPKKERDGCEKCLFVFYIFFQFLLFIGTVIFLGIALGGIPVLFYLLNGIYHSSPMAQNVFYSLAINSLVSPYGVFGIVYMFSRFVGCGEEEMEVKQKESPANELETTKETSEKDNSSSREGKDGKEEWKRSGLEDEIINGKDSKREVLLESNQSKEFGEEDFVSRRKTRELREAKDKV